MLSFPRRRLLPGTGALVIATGALLACPPQKANALPANQGRAAVANQGQAAANQGDNLDQGLIQAIDNVMGIIAQAQQMGMDVPGVDRALRDLVGALINGGQHHHHRHHHHKHHHGFAAGMDQLGDQVNAGNQDNGMNDPAAAVQGAGMGDGGANAQAGAAPAGNAQAGKGQGGQKGGARQVGGQSRAEKGMKATAGTGSKANPGKTAGQVGGHCQRDQGEKKGRDPGANKGQANGQGQVGKGMQALAGAVGGKDQGKATKNGGQGTPKSGSAGPSVGNRASVTINGNNDTVKVVLGKGNNAARVTVNGNNDRVTIVARNGQSAARVTINGNNDSVKIVAAKTAGSQAHQMKPSGQTKTTTGAVAANTTNKPQGNAVAAAPKQAAQQPKGNTVAVAPKQVNQPVVKAAANPTANKSGNTLAKAVQPIKAAGNLSFMSKGGQAKSAPVAAQKPAAAPKPAPAAKPSLIGKVAQGTKTVANLSKGGGKKK